MKISSLLIISLLLVISCSKPNSNKENNDKNDSDQSFTLEGTVVKIFNQIIPSAHATNFAVLLSGGGKDQCGDSEKCAFLVSVKNGEEALIAASPVIAGRFKFNLPERPKDNSIYKVIVRGWDAKDKKPIFGSNDREIVFKGNEINGIIEVNPETTVFASKKLELLKSNLSFIDSIRIFISSIYSKFKNETESIRETFKRLLEESGGDLSLILDDMLQEEIRPDLKIDLFLQKLSISLWTESKLRSVSTPELFIFLDEVNKKIEESQTIAIEQASSNDFGSIISNYFSQQNQYITAQQLQEEIDLDEEASMSIVDEDEKISISNIILNKYDQIKEYYDNAQVYSNYLNESCPKFFSYLRIKKIIKELEDYKVKIYELNDQALLVNEENRPILSQKLTPVESDPNDLNQEEINNIYTYCHKENI